MSDHGFTPSSSLEEMRSGDRYHFSTPSGERLEGTVLESNPPFDFHGTVENLNHALLRFNIFAFQGRRDVHVWASTYDLPEEETRGLEKRWRAVLAALFPEAEL